MTVSSPYRVYKVIIYMQIKTHQDSHSCPARPTPFPSACLATSGPQVLWHLPHPSPRSQVLEGLRDAELGWGGGYGGVGMWGGSWWRQDLAHLLTCRLVK